MVLHLLSRRRFSRFLPNSLTCCSRLPLRLKQPRISRLFKRGPEVLEQSKSAELQDYFQNDCVVPDQAVDLKLVEAATAVLYPVILADRLEILVNIGDEVHQFVHQIEASDLEQLANDFRYNLEIDQGDDEYKALGEELYDIVFADLRVTVSGE